jgi:hypothetical protein
MGQLTQKLDGRTLILHLLNYDHHVPAENVRVRLELNGLVEDLSRWELTVLSPDRNEPRLDGLSFHGSVAEFTLGRIEHYIVVTPQRNLHSRLIDAQGRTARPHR